MDSSVTGSIKGSVLASRLEFVRKELGEAGLERVFERLPAEDHVILSAPLLTAGWYPFPLGERLDLAIADEIGMGARIFRVLGAYSAAHNLGAVHRGYVRDQDPHGLLRQAASIYRLYYDSGRRTYERLGPKKAVLRTYDSRTFSIPDCATVAGWHEKAIEMCGGLRPRVTETHCRARGQGICEYVCEWE